MWPFVCLKKLQLKIKHACNSMSGQSYIAFYMKYPEVKLVASVIYLWSFWKKLNFILGDKCYVNTTPKWNHPKGNICACEFFHSLKKRKVLFVSYGYHYVKSVCIRSYSCPHFPAFGLSTERYGVSLRIQSECRTMRTRATPNKVTFHAGYDLS